MLFIYKGNKITIYLQARLKAAKKELIFLSDGFFFKYWFFDKVLNKNKINIIILDNSIQTKLLIIL